MASSNNKRFIRSTLFLVFLLILLITTVIVVQKTSKYRSSARDYETCSNVGEEQCYYEHIRKCVSYKQGKSAIKAWTTIKFCTGGSTCVGTKIRGRMQYSCSKSLQATSTPKSTPTIRPKATSTPKSI